MRVDMMDDPPLFNPPVEIEKLQNEDADEEEEMTPQQRAEEQPLNHETPFWEDKLQVSLSLLVKRSLWLTSSLTSLPQGPQFSTKLNISITQF